MAHRPPSTILVAVDFGDASAHAVRLAGRLAAAFGAALRVVHADVLEVPAYFTREQIDGIERERARARVTAEDDVRQFVARTTAHPAAVTMVEGAPAEVVLDAARDADLIVMGTHGRRGPSRWWLGSVAERVVRAALVPVLVVHAGQEDAAGNAPVVVLGPERHDRAVREWAQAMADALGVEVEALAFAAECRPDAIAAASLVVVGVPDRPAHRGLHDAAVALARTCTWPTLFVPAVETPSGSEATRSLAAKVW